MIALASYRLERPLAPVEAAGIVAISFALAYLSWRFVERPFRAHQDRAPNRAARRADRRFVLGALVGTVCVAALAHTIKTTKGAPQRYSSGVRHVLEQMVSKNPWRETCDNYDQIFAHDVFCNFGRKKQDNESYEIAAFGDSMADHWVPLVANYAGQQNLAGRQTTNGGCAFLVGVDIPASPAAKARECAIYQKEAVRFVEENPKLKIVVLSAYWEKWITLLDGASGAEPPPSQAAIDGTLEFFTKRGIRVLLIGQVPIYEHLPVRCIVEKLNAGQDPVACGLPAKYVEQQLMKSNAALKAAAAANPLVGLFLPSSVMCKGETCPPVIDGTMIYKNEGHLNRFGAVYLGQFATFPKLD